MIRSSIFVAFATSCLAMPAVAETGYGVAIVRHNDLDLTRSSEVRLLDDRLLRAAAAACGSVSSLDVAGMNRHMKCIQETANVAWPKRDLLVESQASSQPRPSAIATAGRH